jgi:hypothetical protein
MTNNAGQEAYEKSIKSPKPMEPTVAAEILKDVKRILDQHGVVFFLGSGTCLGVVRENQFVPWDDEMDVASVIGLHGLNEETIERVIATFTENGHYAHVGRSFRNVGISVVKSSIRLDWTCFHIINDHIYQYPGIKTPIRLFTQLKEINFIGEKFLVPNPPEEYLRIKYGPDWKIPKAAGFEKDVVQKIPDYDILNRSHRIYQFLTKYIFLWRAAGTFRIIDREGKPVNGAEIVIAGVDRLRTNKQGYARFYVPDKYYYAVIVRYDDHEEVLYNEVLTPGGTYVYRPGPESIKVRAMALSRE